MSQEKAMLCPVSVIIPCYRCADTIDRAVYSVIHQTLPPEEILLIDDFSNDNQKTLTALYSLQRCFKNKIIIIKLLQNTGPGQARNAGWDAAKQSYLAFLDADDSWHPQKLEIQYHWMKAHPNIMLTGHLTIQLKNQQPTQKVIGDIRSYPIYKSNLLFSNKLPTRSVMLQRSINYRFDANKRHSEDYLLWLRLVLSGKNAWLIELPLAYSYKADFGERGLTKNLWKMQCGEMSTYKIIYQDKLISKVTYLGLIFFSLIKFLRRLFLHYFTAVP